MSTENWPELTRRGGGGIALGASITVTLKSSPCMGPMSELVGVVDEIGQHSVSAVGAPGLCVTSGVPLGGFESAVKTTETGNFGRTSFLESGSQ